MCSIQTVPLDAVVLDGYRRGIPSDAAEDGVAAPFAEGGKARTIVRLCADLGLPAVFVDQQGRVFHASAEAAGLLGRQTTIAIRSGVLVGRTPASTARIEDVVSQALCAMGPGATRRSLRVGTSDPIHLTVIDYPNPSPVQLLKAVVVLERRAGECEDDVDVLVGLLDRG